MSTSFIHTLSKLIMLVVIKVIISMWCNRSIKKDFGNSHRKCINSSCNKLVENV